MRFLTGVYISLALCCAACTQAPDEENATLAQSSTPEEAEARAARARAGLDRLWYEGGTLHEATAGEWRRSLYDDRLATAAAFAAAILKPESMDEIRGPALAMKNCIDEAVTEAPDNMAVTEIGALCAVYMDW